MEDGSVRRYNTEAERAAHEARSWMIGTFSSDAELKEALDAGLMKGVEDIRNGKVYSLEEADRILDKEITKVIVRR